MDWNPWTELRRRPHITLQLKEQLPDGVGGGVYARRGARAAILIDRRLTQAERRVVLAHELVHDEELTSSRCEGMPGSWDPVVARDEQRVDVEVARRLVPLEELERSARTAEDLGHCLTKADVAEGWQVTEHIGGLALQQLAEQRAEQRRAG